VVLGRVGDEAVDEPDKAVEVDGGSVLGLEADADNVECDVRLGAHRGGV
jgi:hypothetical protein